MRKESLVTYCSCCTVWETPLLPLQLQAFFFLRRRQHRVFGDNIVNRTHFNLRWFYTMFESGEVGHGGVTAYVSTDLENLMTKSRDELINMIISLRIVNQQFLAQIHNTE